MSFRRLWSVIPYNLEMEDFGNDEYSSLRLWSDSPEKFDTLHQRAAESLCELEHQLGEKSPPRLTVSFIEVRVS
jgi:hypothetical protein